MVLHISVTTLSSMCYESNDSGNYHITVVVVDDTCAVIAALRALSSRAAIHEQQKK
jgi:hypothetical protein